MRSLKAGLKLKSTVCDTQIMVLRAPVGDHELTCGGAEMADDADIVQAVLDPEKAGGTLVGKRYVNTDESLELLCVKGGAGSLCLDGEMLATKQAKALPSSD